MTNKVIILKGVKTLKTTADLDVIIDTNYSSKKVIEEFEHKKSLGLLVGQVQSGKTRHVISLIKEALLNYKYDYVIYLGGTNSALCEQSYNRVQEELTLKVLDNFKIENYNRCVFVIMKEKTILEKMKEFISINSQSKFLIIDDESDFGSVNTKEYELPSKINDLIMSSYNAIKSNQGGLLLVTATPFANLINNKSTKMIDFVWTLPINKEYTGLNFFHDISDKFYIPTIDWYLQQQGDSIFNKNRLYIEFSILIWIAQTILFNKNEQVEPSDLLIYVSDMINDHNHYRIFVNSALDYFRQTSTNNLIKEFLSKFFDNKVSLEEFKNFLKNKIDILMFNNENKNDKDIVKYNNPSSLSNYRIIVGGVFLSRGFTYPTLTTELFLNLGQQRNIDTLLQKCRWFGYRLKNNRYKYMNVITTIEIFDALEKAVELNKLFIKNDIGTKLDVVKLTNEVLTIEENLGISGTSNVKRK